MRTIDLIIIADRWCPTSRTYLTYLAKAGYKPRKILLVDFIGYDDTYIKTRKLLGPRISGWIAQLNRPQWPGMTPLVARYCHDLQRCVEHPVDYTIPFDYTAYADDVQSITAMDYHDGYLHKIILEQSCRIFLYTNGGRVPASLLNQNLKILHIHPGIVPHVRGSDGLLWSIAMRGKPGVSCFYMDPGIDTGPLIATREFDRPRLPFPAPKTLDEEDALYRALLLAYDPHLRASLLCKVVNQANGGALDCLPTVLQIPNPVHNYLWMHPKVRLKIMKEVLCES